jgi:hypothetical protein
MSLSDTRAEDASAKSQSQGSCMPIGLTASGEVVFPWDCRSIIEKQRGPVSVNLPASSGDPSAKDQGPEKEAPAPEQTAAVPSPSQPATAPAQTAAVPAPLQPQIAVASDHMPPVQEMIASPPRPTRARPKRLAAVHQDKNRQVVTQPAPAPAATPAPESKWKRLFSPSQP